MGNFELDLTSHLFLLRYTDKTHAAAVSLEHILFFRFWGSSFDEKRIMAQVFEENRNVFCECETTRTAFFPTKLG